MIMKKWLSTTIHYPYRKIPPKSVLLVYIQLLVSHRYCGTQYQTLYTYYQPYWTGLDGSVSKTAFPWSGPHPSLHKARQRPADRCLTAGCCPGPLACAPALRLCRASGNLIILILVSITINQIIYVSSVINSANMQSYFYTAGLHFQNRYSRTPKDWYSPAITGTANTGIVLRVGSRSVLDDTLLLLIE